jgi:HNH endonuclease
MVNWCSVGAGKHPSALRRPQEGGQPSCYLKKGTRVSETFLVDRGACDDKYCPYCNTCPLDGITDEHVIPQSIGGSGRSVIGICSRCNSNAGNMLDTRVSKHSGLRFIAFYSGSLMRRQEKHQSIATLKDGRKLEGHFYWIEVEKGKVRPGFHPLKHQPDGSQWISEYACVDPVKLPAHLNVYREPMLEYASINISHPPDDGLKPAIIKILLGLSYWVRGMEAVMLPGFDIMRNCLTGVLDHRVHVTWADSLETLNTKNLPFQPARNEHTVWGECADGRAFIGGVSLFGRVTAEIKIDGFGAVLEGRVVGVRNSWLSD